MGVRAAEHPGPDRPRIISASPQPGNEKKEALSMATFVRDDCVINAFDRDNPSREHGTIVAPLPAGEGDEQCYLVQWPSLPAPIEELEGDLLRWETRPSTAPHTR